MCPSAPDGKSHAASVCDPHPHNADHLIIVGANLLQRHGHKPIKDQPGQQLGVKPTYID
jgi:hypothetical protein